MSVEILRATSLGSLPHGFFGRRGGVSTGEVAGLNIGYGSMDDRAAIAENREPTCSGTAAMKSLEMIHAVFAAGLSRGRVELPLKMREHPLGGV